MTIAEAAFNRMPVTKQMEFVADAMAYKAMAVMSDEPTPLEKDVGISHYSVAADCAGEDHCKEMCEKYGPDLMAWIFEETGVEWHEPKEA